MMDESRAVNIPAPKVAVHKPWPARSWVGPVRGHYGRASLQMLASSYLLGWAERS